MRELRWAMGITLVIAGVDWLDGIMLNLTAYAFIFGAATLVMFGGLRATEEAMKKDVRPE